MRYIFITGVSKGLGAALAQRLQGAADCHIIGLSRTQGNFHGNFHSCDLTQPQLLEKTMEAVMQSIDLSKAQEIVFINNAGQLGPLDFIDRLAAEDIQDNLTANLISSSLLLSLFLKYTSNRTIPKAFINISSGAALPERAKPGWSLYCASKAAQEQLIRAVALEQSHAPAPAVLINFNPGVMETNMQKLIRQTPKENFPDVNRFIQLHEDGKTASPTKIAQILVEGISKISSLENGKTYQPTDFQTIS